MMMVFNDDDHWKFSIAYSRLEWDSSEIEENVSVFIYEIKNSLIAE